MENPGISIIVPVYNTSETLHRCVESLYSQTFKDFEVILVNDGSTDNSADLCQEILKKDSRFSYQAKKNGGLSSARNHGMKYAKGEFVAFLDSDDYVDGNFCQILYETAKPLNLDILNFGLKYVKDGVAENRASAFPKDRLIPRQEMDDLISKSSSNKVLYFSWSNMYRREFLETNSLIFDERVLLGEDTVFNLKALMHSSTVYSISAPVYNYVYNTNSLTQKKFKENLLKKFESQFNARMEIHKAWPEINSEVFMQDIAQNYVETTFFMLLANLHNSPGDRVKLAEEMRNSVVYEFSFSHSGFPMKVSLPMRIRVFLFRNRFFNLLLKV